MNNRKAFTLVELLTSVIIIALLLGLLLPSISMVRTKSKETAQKAQFATISMALEAFKQDYGDYPPSGEFEGLNTTTGLPYNGGQKLTEALLGWDLAGFHPKTAWRRDGLDASSGISTYDPCRADPDPTRTLRERKGPYLDVAKTPVFRLGTSNAAANDGLYNSATNTNFAAVFNSTVPNYVICDVFGVKKLTIPHGTQNATATAGTPILYYKADTSYKTFTCLPRKWPTSMYKYTDNIDLINLGILPNATKAHTLSTNVMYFCYPEYKIMDTRVPSTSNGSWPNRPDTFILISAGADHEFGTNDDILNF
ncbi:MAG: prepilin-type N-terminal cleavage/methylation domain-containing protein [Sedimentisphaerales bacterium]|jgi:prepilin-type N-terminal cleavage/methylation domain-containing protein